MFIAEKGLDIPTTEVDLRNGEQLKPEFLAINPAATVPVLQTEDGTNLVTTPGCRAYLENSFPEPALLGRNNTERGVVADRIAAVESDGFMAIAECLRNTAKGMKDRALPGPVNYAQIPELGERGRERAQRFFGRLDAMIGDQPYVAGDAFTAADIDAFIFCEFSKWIKLEMPAELTNLKRWFDAVGQRDSAKL
jgi:glutathione S-transferase